MSQLNLISFFGLLVMILIAWSMSSFKSRVNWRLVVVGVSLQFLLAAILFQSQNWTFGGQFENGILFAAVDGFFKAILFYVSEGAGFMFSINGLGAEDPTNPKSLLQTFAFGVLPTVIFFAALMSILYHLGVMQVLIRGMAWVMRKTLGTTGPESLAAAANVLVGHTEAPLVIKPYVGVMTRSELNALMVGGFSTISGSLMAIFVNQGHQCGAHSFGFYYFGARRIGDRQSLAARNRNASRCRDAGAKNGEACDQRHRSGRHWSQRRYEVGDQHRRDADRFFGVDRDGRCFYRCGLEKVFSGSPTKR